MSPSEFPAKKLVGPLAAALDLALVRDQLRIGRLGAQLHYFTELDSTNTRARELADAGAAEGEIVLAESQTQGRGRLGRRWESPAFRNLYLSIILRPNLAPAFAGQITLMAAVAVAETVGFFIGRPPEIKWPNDILTDGKKLAGILAEAACDAKRVEYVVLGIGLNVDYRAETMPEALRRRATSMAEVAGQPVSRDRVLVRLIQDLDRCYAELEESGFVALQPRWEAHFGLCGKQVRIDLGDETLLGRALGIDREGALILATVDGQRRSIVAGDVIPLET
jgi:BirA family biotin operon repressor/biotin-[acetyl-CoA-carboxylase] ligase